jgi:hypothetical protein
MKRSLSIAAFICVFAGVPFGWAQTTKPVSSKHPTSFTIDKPSLDKLFACTVNAIVKDKNNKFINGSTVLINSSYKENKQLKLKLSYFKNAELFVQINGKDSKILYILSSDNSVFYNSKETDKGFTMTLCQKDDIVSE